MNGGYAFYEMGVRLSTYEQALLTRSRATVVQNRGSLHYAFAKLYASTCMSLANETAQVRHPSSVANASRILKTPNHSNHLDHFQTHES